MYEMEGPRRFDSFRATDRSGPTPPNPVTCDVDTPVARSPGTSGALRKASELVSAAGDVRDF